MYECSLKPIVKLQYKVLPNVQCLLQQHKHFKYFNLIQNSQAVKLCGPKKAMMKEDVKLKVVVAVMVDYALNTLCVAFKYAFRGM